MVASNKIRSSRDGTPMIYFRHYMNDHGRLRSHFSMLEDGAYLRLASIYCSRMGSLPDSEEEIYRLADARSGKERRAIDQVLKDCFRQTPEGWSHDDFDDQIKVLKNTSAHAATAARTRWDRKRSPEAAEMDNEFGADAMRLHSGRTAIQEPVATTQEPGASSHDPRARSHPPVSDSHETNNMLSDPPAFERAPPFARSTVEHTNNFAGTSSPVNYDPDFLCFWSAFPRKVGKDAALRAWRDAKLRHGPDAVRIIQENAEALAASSKGVEERWIPHPSTWLNEGRFLDPQQQTAKPVATWRDIPANRMAGPAGG
jgi:uncharacterized protein YdaU (DUF1376 family)